MGPHSAFYKVEPSFKKQQFVAIGRFVAKKAPHLTITAFSQIAREFPKARLIFGGDGPRLDACIDLVNALGIQEQVYFFRKTNPSTDHGNFFYFASFCSTFGHSGKR